MKMVGRNVEKLSINVDHQIGELIGKRTENLCNSSTFLKETENSLNFFILWKIK